MRIGYTDLADPSSLEGYLDYLDVLIAQQEKTVHGVSRGQAYHLWTIWNT